MKKITTAKTTYDAILYCTENSEERENFACCEFDVGKEISIKEHCFKSKFILPLCYMENTDRFIADLKVGIDLANRQNSKSTAIILSSDEMETWLDRKLVLRMINTIISMVEESEMKVFLVFPDNMILHKHLFLEPVANSHLEKMFAEHKFAMLEHTLADAVLNLFGRHMQGAYDIDTELATHNKKVAGQIPENCKALFEEMPAKVPTGLYHFLKENEGERFPAMLKRLISERGLTASQCYNKANVSRKVYWKILNEVNYRPSKQTVLAFAVALQLNFEETQALLANAGYSLSHSDKFDLIVEYHIREGIYDTYIINCALFLFDQVLLGA